MKVLIIDDEPLIRRSLEKCFLKAGHQVVLAEDGHEGVSQWRAERPDAVIIDVLMPGLSGPEVIAEVKPDSKQAIALISAYSGDYDPDSVKQLGADVFIEKPFDNILSIVLQMEELYREKLS